MKVHVPGACAGAFAPVLALFIHVSAADAADDQREAARLESRWVESMAANGLSHASGARPELGAVVSGNPTQASLVMRVGLYYPAFNASGGVVTEFSTLHHPSVSVSSTVGDVEVRDRSDGRRIATMRPGSVFGVSHDGSGFVVTQNAAVLGTYAGPILFQPTLADEQLSVESIRRTNILGSGFVVPRYWGALEVARGPATQADRVNVFNAIELERYVPGVVANESLASFHMEALKAQATAARGYAAANLGRFESLGYPFDIVDSASSQVYRGIISEHPRAVQAAAETFGLVGSYQGRIISALYSSSMGGYTEGNEWIFPSPPTSLPGANAEPYLRGIYDGTGTPPDLADPAVLAAFWKNQQPLTSDSCARVNNRFSRWMLTIPAATIKARLPGRYVLVSGNAATVLDGDITDLTLPLRMSASRRLAIARVTLNTGIVEVRGWDNLRFVLGRTVATTTLNCGTAVGANFTLNNPSVVEPAWNTDGTLKEVVAWGGGWGHNVGMSQYGAHGRGTAGETFLEILNAYYTGVEVGTHPIDILVDAAAPSPALEQQFQAAQGKGTLEVRAHELQGLVVRVNDLYEVVLSERDLEAEVARVDLTPYLTAGLNVVEYEPIGRRGSATVAVIID